MKGTGLGLSICARLADVLGGKIGVESRLNEGTTFSIVLPASALALRLEPALRPAWLGSPDQLQRLLDGDLLSLRILLVEDHASTREGTSRILRAEGAEVIEAADGTTALDLLASVNPDVLLLDMMLPDVDGIEILRQVRANPPTSLRGIFVLTGDLTRQRRDDVRRLGADGLIEKPIDVQKLIEILRHLERAPQKAPDVG
jgi:CheY-like chemotaxis protein